MGRVTRRKTYKTQTPEPVKHVNSPQRDRTPHKSRHARTQTPEKHIRAPCSSRESRHRTPVRHHHVRTSVMAHSHSPYLDDGFPLSQAPGEVGWDASAQYPAGNSKMRISDIMKNFHLENQKGSLGLEAIPGTPPPLDLWRADSPLSQNEALPEPVRPRRKQHRKPQRSKTAVNSMAMLSKLQSVLANLKAQEETKESLAEGESEQCDNEPRRSERLSQRTKSEAESNLDVSSARSNSLERSSDLFEAHPIAKQPTGPNTDNKVSVPCSTPKRPSGNHSCDELWTDEEPFDDSFMRLTQAFEQCNGFVTPRGTAQKRKNCLTTPEGGLARKTGRFVVSSEAKADENVHAMVPCASTPKRGGVEERAGSCNKPRGIITDIPEPISSSDCMPATGEKSSTECANTKPISVVSSARLQHPYGTRNTIYQTKSVAVSAQGQFVHPQTASAVTSNHAATCSSAAGLPFRGYNDNKVNSTISKKTMSSTQITSKHQNNPTGPARTHQGVKPQFQRHHSMPVSGKGTGVKPVSPINCAAAVRPELKATQTWNPQSTTCPAMTRNRVGATYALASTASKTGKGAISPPLCSGPKPSGTQLSPHNQLGNLSMIGSCSQFGAQVLATSTQVSVNRAEHGRKPVIAGPQIQTSHVPKPSSTKLPSPRPAFKIPSKPERKVPAAVAGTSAGTSYTRQSLPPVNTGNGAYEPLLDMSISDDVLANLAEPDDILDSQECMELLQSPTETKNVISSQASTVTFDDSKLPGEKLTTDWSDGDWDHLDNLMLEKANIKTVPRRTKSGVPTPKVVGLDDDEEDGLFDDDVLTMIEEVELRASQEKQQETVRPATRSAGVVQVSEVTQQISVSSNTTVPAKSLPVNTLPVAAPAASKKTGLFKFKSSSHLQKSQLSVPNCIRSMPAHPNNIDPSKGNMTARTLDVAPKTSHNLLPQHSKINPVGTKQEDNSARKIVKSNKAPLPDHASNKMGQTNQGRPMSTTVSNHLPKSGTIPLTKANGVNVSTKGVSPLPAVSRPYSPANVGEAAKSASSSGSSTVTNSPVKCSMEEIQKKRLEAMKKRENRLKLSKPMSK